MLNNRWVTTNASYNFKDIDIALCYHIPQLPDYRVQQFEDRWHRFQIRINSHIASDTATRLRNIPPEWRFSEAFLKSFELKMKVVFHGNKAYKILVNLLIREVLVNFDDIFYKI